MVVTVEPGATAPAVHMRDPSNFGELKVVISDAVSMPEAREALSGVGEPRADGRLWIHVPKLQQMAGLDPAVDRDAAAWSDGFSKMLAYAASRGWLDDERNMVAAHCEVNGERIDMETESP